MVMGFLMDSANQRFQEGLCLAVMALLKAEADCFVYRICSNNACMPAYC